MAHLFHAWQTIRDTGKHRYQECRKCHKRRVVDYSPGGYQPIDRAWLAGGEFFDPQTMLVFAPQQAKEEVE